MSINKKDIIFALICGLLVSWLAIDFLGAKGLIFVIILPILSIIGLWIVNIIGKKISFVEQIGRFVLVGAFADVIDIKVFQFLFWLLPFSLLFKAVSFLIATLIKYWWNKHWAFGGAEKTEPKKFLIDGQLAYFFIVTLIGLGLNVVSFYFFGRIETGLPAEMWTEVCIILAALVAAVSNFLGYKFLVFKK